MSKKQQPQITLRERSAILQSLAAGVVPALGLQYIQVGRKEEVEAVIKDLKLVENGGSTIRFIVGKFGSGKSFFLHLMRTVALRRRFVVVQADLTITRRLHSTTGDARALFVALMHNLATQANPQGGAIRNVIEKWIGELDYSIRENDGSEDDVKKAFAAKLTPLRDLVSGFDFVRVLTRYYEGYLTQDDHLQANALRWLCGEYTTKTEARSDLDVRSIIDDESYYDFLKLFAAFVRIVGYSGLVVSIDELAVITHNLTSGPARKNNFEVVKRILNDCLQCHTEGLLFLFAGSDECLENRQRGLYSDDALATRLGPVRLATKGLRDLSSPVIRLNHLTRDDCLLLLTRIQEVFAAGDTSKDRLTKEDLSEFLNHCDGRLGASSFQSPRDVVRKWVSLLNLLDQNPMEDWRKLLADQPSPSTGDKPADAPQTGSGQDLARFRL